MAVTFGLSLSVSWICCLLIGGITCFTLQGNAYGHPASTGAQASVVSVPSAKATGHNSLANVTSGRNASAEVTGPRASAATTAPRASAEATGPRASAEATGPRASAEATGPRASAEATGPRASAEATGPRASAEATGPGASAEATGSRASAEATSLEQMARPLNKLDREIIIWFAQLLNRLSPVTVPPFEEKAKVTEGKYVN
uniref:putative uncharacterized protein ENSP00000383309 isoform X5 n=1 Tax=Oncorhynchus gorbuscha TaxID=8017 RepID=UPI001EAF3AA1|nr:putative uncharacterized protein ENSP00000383309 isoform X5 [Oncorhynchus gorbuscha]XP_046155000.1 putative uncharacterized protein ENSP00000383309 isoform X6 [Oncorhynchus gorbuscha]